MSARFNGRDALAELDTQLARVRQSLSDALTAADSADARRGAIQGEQAAAYGALAAIRLDIMQASGSAAFGELEASAKALTERHEVFVAEQKAALEAAAAELSHIEQAREKLAAQHDAAVETYERTVAATESELKGSEAYTSLAAAAEEARAVTQRAAQKLELAKADRTEKGAPYRDDLLFSYLWKRKFRSPEYKAGGLTRLLDGWVAGLCKYDQAFLNYQRLTELPDRIAEHAAYVAGLEAACEARLVEAEERAMEAAGTGALQVDVDRFKLDIAGCDEAIRAAENHHRATAASHLAALNEEAGPAVEARALLEAELRKASFPDLRVLAAETVELEDDRTVDDLVRLRAEEMSLELEAGKRKLRPKVLGEDLSRLEELRREFKAARFDSPYALISRAAFDEMISDLMRGKGDPRGALRGLGRSVRRMEPDAHPDFGGRSRRDTIGMPDILGGMIGGVLGEVLEEVIKETTRGSGGYGSGPIFPGPPKRTPRPPKIGGRSSGGGGRRSGGKRSGGFKTGGGF